MQAAIYARISKDDGTALGVARQLEDCRREAERRRWSVVREFVDNDVSASNGKARPEFERMMREVDAGRLKGIVVWDADRLSRSPRENEDLIDRAEKHGLRLANVGGDMDLSTVSGRTTFRIKGAISRAEVEQQSRRIKRKNDERAEQGRPHGKITFGWRRVVDYDEKGRRVGSRDEIDDAQADVLREAARRLLGGESLRSVARALNEAGAPTPNGSPWMSTTLRQTLLRERNAGLRIHRGEVLGKGDWPPVYDQGTHDRVCAMLRDPSRRTNRGSTRKHLLSGLALCGLCGGPMRVIVATQQGDKTVASKYQCAACTRVARKQDDVERYVVSVVVERLSRPDALAALATGRPERAAELRTMIDDANARLALAADSFADGTISGEQLRRVSASLRPKVEEWQQELASCAPIDGLLDLTGPEAARRWESAALDVRRAVIDVLMSIVVMPSGRGYRFDGARDVLIVPKQA